MAQEAGGRKALLCGDLVLIPAPPGALRQALSVSITYGPVESRGTVQPIKLWKLEKSAHRLEGIPREMLALLAIDPFLLRVVPSVNITGRCNGLMLMVALHPMRSPTRKMAPRREFGY